VAGGVNLTTHLNLVPRLVKSRATPTDGVGRDSFLFTFMFSQRIYQTNYFILKESGKTKIKMKLMEPQRKMGLRMWREEL
jgi:hypothetical protein